MRRAFCIGLTGGIGSGKSTAASLFEELGAGIVDTDRISHELTRAGGAALPALEREFGSHYLREGALDRARMRELVFSDPTARKRLESILHPLIRKCVKARIGASRAPYVIVVVPLLFETGAYRELVSRVVAIDCSEEQQIDRAVRRGGMTAAEVRAVMAAQLTREERLAQADDVLRNDTDTTALRRAVDRLHVRYLELARRQAMTVRRGAKER